VNHNPFFDLCTFAVWNVSLDALIQCHQAGPRSHNQHPILLLCKNEQRHETIYCHMHPIFKVPNETILDQILAVR
jgi:hypothetical protein